MPDRSAPMTPDTSSSVLMSVSTPTALRLAMFVGELGLVAQCRRQDHRRRHLERQPRLDVDAEHVLLERDLVAAVHLAVAEHAVVAEQLHRRRR